MQAKLAIDFNQVPEVRQLENGQTAISGKLLTLEGNLQRVFLRWADEWGAQEYRFPTLISAQQLAKLDYFRSFPHLVTFPGTLDPTGENLDRFSAGEPVNPHREVQLTGTAPIKDVLTPAAC